MITNKINQLLNDKGLSNGELLEKAVSTEVLKNFIKLYFIGLSIFLITLFTVIVTFRLAINIL